MNILSRRLLSFKSRVLVLATTAAVYADNANVGTLATTISESFSGIVSLIIGMSYVAGLGFGIAGLFKFKQHKDNPTQVPIGTPLSMIMISAALVFLPGIYAPLGYTIFGTGATLYGGGTTGAGAAAIPGFSQ